MKNRTGHILLSYAIILLAAVWFNDFLVALVSRAEYGSTGYILHLAAFTAIVAVAVYFKQEQGSVLRRLTACRLACQELPCAVVVRVDAVSESFGDAELIALCRLTQGVPDGGAAGEVTVEELQDADGRERLIERRLIPLTDSVAGCYTEVVLDITGRTPEARDREEDYVKMLQILVNMFEMKDPYSNGHSEAVRNLAQDMGRALGITRAGIAALARAAILHDIGKIIIPPEILNKSGELTPAERAIVEAHSDVGADILANLCTFREEAVIVRHHHERFDGGGYPGRLRGADIPLGARIIAVADAFDAMTAGRSVRGRRDVAGALDILEAEKGRQFDPDIVTVFRQIVTAGQTPPVKAGKMPTMSK